jgi:16S rRNA (guanine527-N7)-methyltransferase
MTAATEDLREVLERARTSGFLGPGPVEAHIVHAEGFGAAAESALGHPPRNFADLGTGGGIPGLVLGVHWERTQGVFVESGTRRCAWLREARALLGIEGRVEVVEERAEAAAGPGPRRENFEVVTARSFAGPAVTAEIAAGLVEVGGILVVSEPPDRDDRRWPVEGLAELGFAPAVLTELAGAHFVVIRKAQTAPDRIPRTVGKPAKRPLW